MPETDRVHELAAQWLGYAEGDLASCRATGSLIDEYPVGVAFHAQQAIEKALKAVLVHEQIDFPRTHSLRVIADLLPEDWSLDLPVNQFPRISHYAAETRYPVEGWNDVPQVTPAEVEAAIGIAVDVVDQVRRAMVARGISLPGKSE